MTMTFPATTELTQVAPYPDPETVAYRASVSAAREREQVARQAIKELERRMRVQRQPGAVGADRDALAEARREYADAVAERTAVVRAMHAHMRARVIQVQMQGGRRR